MKSRTVASFRLTGEDPQLVRLTDEIAEQLESGKPFDLEAFVTDYPDYTSELRRLYPALQALVGLGVEKRSSSDTDVNIRATEKSIDRTLGDFRILAEIGRGGMGVVYKAQQISLGRHVALKVLPFAAMLDQQQLNRFKNEARAAATLDHPGIVSVYSVGSDRGVHYYAMQLIEGQSLSATIRELRILSGKESQLPDDQSASQLSRGLTSGTFGPSDFKTAATHLAVSERSEEVVDKESGEKVPAAETNAQQANISTQLPNRQTQFFRSAAELGVQAALALDHAHQRGILHRDIKPGNLLLDSQGKLWITDFGLARIETDAGMTMSGDLLGTLRYMPPEQALAKRVVIDQRADIYSLGATLYELLTLQPAVEGDDRKEVLRQIAFEEPREPRQLNPSIPVDLETIIAKAMRKEASERYSTAQELAEDLTHFLRYEPIKARRPTLAERAMKWTHRHRGLVWATAAILFVALSGLAISMLLIAREGQRTQREKLRAEAHFLKAREAVDRMLTKAADELADVPHAEHVRQALLDDALEFYQTFLDQKSTDPEIQFETALAFERVGAIHAAMGDRAAASHASWKAIAILETLHTEYPEEPKYRIGLADAHGTLSLSTLVPVKQEDLYHRRQRLLILEELARDFPQVSRYQSLAAEAHARLGYGLLQANLMSEAIEQCRAAVVIAENLKTDFPDHSPDLKVLAYSHHWLGAALVKTKHFREGEQHLRQALYHLEQFLERSPSSPGQRHQIVLVMTWIGHSLKWQGKNVEALGAYRKAIAINRQLLAEFPNRSEYLSRAATLHNDLAQTLALAGQEQEAVEALRTSIFHQERLLQDDPNVSGFMSYLAWQQFKLGSWHYRQGESSKAVVAFQRTERLWRQYIDKHQSDLRAKNGLAWFLATCPLPQLQDGPQAVQIAKELAEKEPANQDHWLTLGAAYYRAAQLQEALAALEEAEQRSEEDLYAGFLAAICHSHLGQEIEARDCLQRAISKVNEQINSEYVTAEDARIQFFQNPELGFFWTEAEALIEKQEPHPGQLD